MIAYLKGILADKDDTGLTLLTPGGVGYRVAAPTSVLSALPAPGGEAEVFVHTNVSEKAIDLYGFLEEEERRLFRTLISIDKLGPKKALAILSHFDPERLREISFREDDKALATVPGIGPKSAKQILWFLKDKMAGMAEFKARIAVPDGVTGSEFLDALAGLANLGYSEEESRPLLKEIFEAEPDLDAAGAIRQTLRRIASAR
ncbi:Holliday junction DNA helicase subunit RuvA [Paucidesulfovibrio gracilis DSM 16080]|uniref:Holliday junction branch migration complex subunit RuvA n=1 Tax=Paucidesulfovibrio gracilis DSM 16080 TaxID=1121449 RepID=A0A1T4WAL8_9BACT|nr:Holliday junction branch migration protein RuvA [Paucidesulfovibrio gracilis]SKA74088.1 Holliday junction DNA helicase subunit RuvA [Paucidesulfovibrio gracilis DSM 16080]